MIKTTFDEMVDKNLAFMIHELCKGTKWRDIVFVMMDRTLIWYKETHPDKESDFMIKILTKEIISCLDCPNYGEGGGYCLLVEGDNRGHKTTDDFPFPKWCPLPNKPKSTNDK